MNIDRGSIQNLLEVYCDNVRETRRHPGHHPETSLYPHFERVISGLASALGYDVQIIQQYTQKEIGSPDFGISHAGGPIVSSIEAKPPDERLGQFTGRSKEQFDRYMRLPNLIYTNYWELRLYQNGEMVARAELVPPQCLEPQQSHISEILGNCNVTPVIDLLRRFFSFIHPDIYSISELAEYLARAAWLVREAVADVMAVQSDSTPLHEIYYEFRDVLFHRLEPLDFADAYAQTLAYGLLLARQVTQAELKMSNIVELFESQQNRLLSATLRLFLQPQVVQMIGWTVSNLTVVINSIYPSLLSPFDIVRDPLLYFYEDFLTVYDPELRRQRGVYYTPPEVVNLQTRVIDHLLVNSFGKRYGFADETVETLDPATGTGTYLISALRQGCRRIEQAMGADSVPDAASSMAKHLHGFEILIGPYTVAQFRLTSAIEDHGGKVDNRLPILLTDTLVPAYEQRNIQSHFGFMSGPLTEESRAADEVKNRTPIMIVLGNPPYRRVRAGESKPSWVWEELLETFRRPVPGIYRGELGNLAEKSIWFYRWAVWKLFEADNAPKRGILSFIAPSRWILGGAFGGMRQVFRNYFDRIYIIDLHGDNRAPLPAGVARDDNVFDDTQVGVAISICVADGSQKGQQAKVLYYGGKWGTRQQKYEWLKDYVAADLSNVPFEEVHGCDTEPFFPKLGKLFSSWPDIKGDLFRFSQSAVKTQRDELVIAPTRHKLEAQIKSFLSAPDEQKPLIFKESDRIAADVDNHVFDSQFVVPYGYRPLDRHFLYNESRFIDRPRPRLQKIWGSDNIALTTLSSSRPGAGPVVFLHRYLPDICAFRGSYTSRVFPLWDKSREGEGVQGLPEVEHNLNADILDALSSIWDQQIVPIEVFAYCYAVLSAPSYSVHFSRDLARSSPKVPFPLTCQSYKDGVRLGEKLLNIHSFQQLYPADGSLQLHGLPQHIEFVEYSAVEQRLSFASGAWVEPVTPKAWLYSVSGYEVLRRWMARRREVPFDMEIRKELLDIIWVIERTVELSSELDDFLSRLIEGKTLTTIELGLNSES